MATLNQAEAQAWLQIQEALLASFPNTLAAAAPQDHGPLHTEHCRSLAAVAGSLGSALTDAAADSIANANAAATEAVAWGSVADAAAKEAVEAAAAAQNARAIAVAAAPQADRSYGSAPMPPSMMQAAATFSEPVPAVGASDTAERAAEVQRLDERKAELRREVSALEREHEGVRHSLETRKAESLQERSRLHSELEGMRQELDSQTSRLQQVRTEAQHEAAVLEETRSAAASAASAQRDGALSASASGGVASASSRDLGSPRSRGAPSLEGGLAALQAVREQLREMRDGTGSPTALGAPGSPRVVTSTAVGGSSAVASPTPLRHAHSAVITPEHTTRGGLAHAHSAGAFDRDDGVASPWKNRLLKLQGDLRSLRSELSSTPQ